MSAMPRLVSMEEWRGTRMVVDREAELIGRPYRRPAWSSSRKGPSDYYLSDK